MLLSLIGAACCCGLPGLLAWPAAQQYPVSAVLPQSFADLSLRDDQTSRQAVDRLSEQLRDAGAVADQVFAGLYTDGNGKRVTVFGTTGFRWSPEADVEAQLRTLAGEFHLADVRSYDLGETGAHERCAVGRTGGTTMVVCAWADHGSLATVLLTRRSVAESADLVGSLRSAVLTHG